MERDPAEGRSGSSGGRFYSLRGPVRQGEDVASLESVDRVHFLLALSMSAS